VVRNSSTRTKRGRALERRRQRARRRREITLGLRAATWCSTRSSVRRHHNDGVTIAREIELEDVFREPGRSAGPRSGDQDQRHRRRRHHPRLLCSPRAIVREGLRMVAAGANPMAIKKGIEAAVRRRSRPSRSSRARCPQRGHRPRGHHLGARPRRR